MRATRGPCFGMLIAALLAVDMSPVGAVTGFDAAPGPATADDPYAAGVAAFEQEDWRAVLDHMAKALDARPWEDNAHNLMGFAYRKLGNYPAALDAYGKALLLNPYHRGALEYLGEAYLELDRPDDAQDTLNRLAEACRLVDDTPSCEEWQELNEAYEAYLATEAASAR